MKRVALLAAALLLCSTTVASADDVIFKGIDTFTTTTDGSTRYSFATNPIPAGFFCKGSAPFTGEVPLKGLPLVTAEKDQLRGADTIVERLDDAAFDRSGVAVTRIKMGALSLVSIEPIQTACGAFHLYATLAGPQRSTTMRIYREHERGGTFVAPLAVDAHLRFVPVGDRAAQPLEMRGTFNLSSTREPWAVPGDRFLQQAGEVFVDTDGDGAPDRRFTGTSNFAAGHRSAAFYGLTVPDERVLWDCWDPWSYCHGDDSDLHCVQCCGCVQP